MTIAKALLSAAGAVALLAAAAGPGGAQSGSQSGVRAVTGSASSVATQDQRPRKKSGRQPQQMSRATAAPQSTGSTLSTGRSYDYTPTWTIEQALPGKPASQSRDVPRISSQNPTRVPLETGTFGLETKSQFRQNQFSDGRTIPGLEATKRDDPSYFGLSLQVPTNNVPLLPLLSPPSPNR